MMGGNVEAMLQGYVNRIENLEADKAAVVSDIKDVYTEVKSAGLDVKILRLLIRERKLTAAERAERDALLETYKDALGMLGDTPLGDAAMKRAAANPSVRRAVKQFVDSTKGSDVSIELPGHDPIHIRDGKVLPAEAAE